MCVEQNLCYSFIFRLTDAVLPVGGVLVALVAEALEGAQSVDALAVPAHLALQSAALVDVCEVNQAANVSTFPTRPESSRRRAPLLPMQSLLCVSSKPGKQRQL